MKKQFKIDVTSPCSEYLNNFSPIDSTEFCEKCSKHVIDFTNKNDREVLEFLAKANEKTCGKFKPSQLKTYPAGIISKPSPPLKWLGVGVMGLSLLFPTSNSFGQTHQSISSTEMTDGKETNATRNQTGSEKRMVKGTVVDDANFTLPGVNVMLKGTFIGTTTNIDGEFQFEQALKIGDILTFSFIGLESKEYIISDLGSPNIVMEMNVSLEICDVIITGEVAVDHLYSSKRNIWQKVASIFK